jgi:hypothetical protein
LARPAGLPKLYLSLETKAAWRRYMELRQAKERAVSLFLSKGLIGGIAALSLVGALSTSAVSASAADGGAIAAGVVGGLALGAIAGSAAANNGYRPYPAYGGPAYGGGCYFRRQPVYDEYGEVIGRRRVRVCE